MKTKRFFLFGLLAVLLALGLVLVGCGDDDEEESGSATATVTGTPQVGQTLTVTFTGFTPDPGDISWTSGGATGEGTTISSGATYEITAQDVNDYIWVEAHSDGYTIEVESNRVGPVVAAN
ncbi:MAG: hypothetical protein LBK61_07405 [Spirochaetaceae bacterium]|nr:hypothetical protein [Spirochaetaceae bacterium]